MSCAICQSFEHLVEECPILPAAREMFGMPCGICQSFEHLVEECPIIPVAREIFGDYNTYNSNCRNHPNFFWEPQPLRQEIDSQDKKMDEVQHDLSQKIDNLQDSISRFANLNTMQEKENSPSQPHQNQKGIHEMEAKEGDKEVDLPTCKLEHKEESETEKEKREESIASNGAQFGVETKKLWPFEDDCAKLNGNVAAEPISLLLDTFLEHFLELKLCIPYVFLKLRKSGVQCFKTVCNLDLKRRSYGHLKESNFAFGRLRAPVEETMPSKENTRTEAKVLIQPTQKATTDASAPQDLTII
uniref:Uncharacterized protein n=1 Tax=Vitis vinifera TaxID=29760 RepID=A5BDW4_VITVI|nr:hypothetical protein VITISV_035482 [Vitis vinifera]